MRREYVLVLGILLVGVLAVSGVYAQEVFSQTASGFQHQPSSFNSYYSQEDISTYWPILRDIENDQCEADSDFIVMIRPGSCTPPVVRSDLLAEQNVPVFCQLDAVKVNPLIKVSSIKSIGFKGEYPEGVVGISFHPARAAIRTYDTLLGSPLINNIGYVVIILKQEKIEGNLTDWIEGNLTATIHYDAEEAYGVGAAEFYSPVMSDKNWSSNYVDYSFWQGRGFLRTTAMENGEAKIALYRDKETIFQDFVLKEGETSNIIYFPGFYCRAGLKVKLNKVTSPEKQARLNIDGNEIWVREGSKVINDRCRVDDISILEEGGSVLIKCPSENINLILQKKGAKINNNDYGIGKNVNSDWYLGYVGSVPGGVVQEDDKKESFVVLIKSSGELSDENLIEISQRVADVSDIKSNVKTNQWEDDVDRDKFKENLKTSLGGVFGSSANVVNVVVLYDGEGEEGMEFNGFSESVPDDILDEDEVEYFGLSDEVTRELLKKFTHVKMKKEKLSEGNLWKQIEIAGKLGQFEDKKDYLNEFVKNYPDSKIITSVKSEQLKMENFDVSRAWTNVFVGNNYHYIGVDGFKDVDETSKAVEITYGKEKYWFEEGREFYLDSGKILVKKIDVGKVTLVYFNDDLKSESLEPMGEGESVIRGGVDIIIRKINVQEVAYISLIPEIERAKTDADFSFKIGIEKRGIKLSPERTKLMIENLNKSIDKWQSLNEKLGKLVKGWKGVCLATSTYLMLKNTFSSFTGQSMARQRVMETYRARCDLLVSQGKYASRSECYISSEISSGIKNDVEKMTEIIERTNKRLNDINEDNIVSRGGLFEGDVINSTGSLNKFKGELGESVSINVGGEEEIVFIENIDSYEQAKAVMEVRELEREGASTLVIDAAKERRDGLLQEVLDSQEKDSAIADLRGSAGGGMVGDIVDFDEGLERRALRDTTWSEELGDKVGVAEEDKDEEKIQFIKKNNRYFALVVVKNSADRDSYIPKRIYEVDKVSGNFESLLDDDGKVISTEPVEKKIVGEIDNYIFASGGRCENPMINAKIQFYELAPNDNLPAIVPFDLKRGWYVKVPQTIGGVFSSGEAGYRASGDVSFFYICNVGGDGREENTGGDDICQSFDVNTYKGVESFGGCDLSAREIQNLASNARKAVRQAAQQYGAAGKTARILGQEVDIHAPLTGANVVECQDFMSPGECKILFNACDPVICPASRCDLGGKMPVANVVQTGIVGGIFLCLPNWKEGVYVPLCLTGIHAGIDNYVSILESEQECLQRSLDSGESVGICDEITSVYKCEFFWRQIAPFTKAIVPRIIGSAYGLKGTRGGGEYLSVKHAFDSLDKSVGYFKNVYAESAFRAFMFKNIQEAGTEICRMFVGTSLPASAEALDSFLEPESPTQFYARFDEVPFTGATVPATSQYKVYYHVFAGNDRGVNYFVYLKNPPATSYYVQNPTVSVKIGFIPKGEKVDEAIDFTAPAGYKELCVRIDGQDHCGFGQVTTSFGLNYLSKKYIEDQVGQNISSEKECISGSPSLWGLANPNIQAGAEELLNPEIAMRGIVRVCSTDSPGKAVDGKVGDEGRWSDVGYCGNKNIRCWLDRESVEKDLRDVQAIEGTSLSGVEDGFGDIGKGRKLERDAEIELDNLDKEIQELDVKLNRDTWVSADVSGIAESLRRLYGWKDYVATAYSNEQKARAMALEGDLYRHVLESLVRPGKKLVRMEDVEVDEVEDGEEVGEVDEASEDEPVEEEVRGAESIKFIVDDQETISIAPQSGVDIVLEIKHNCDSIKYKFKNNEYGDNNDVEKLLEQFSNSVGEYEVEVICFVDGVESSVKNVLSVSNLV